MKKLKLNDILFYCLLFLLFLVWNLVLTPISLDEIWNYGFSHNIYNGLVPYRDFNMIITPFYPMFMSLFFFVFGSSSLVMHVVNALMLTFFSFLLSKIIGEKTWLVVFFLFFFMQVTFPGYNIFLVMLFILLIYLENIKSSDYFIGIVLALFVLTKQTVGILMFFVSFWCLKDKKSIFKRTVGFLGPCFIFLIYLVITNSYIQFFDLCFLGLFDFAISNSGGFNIYWVFFIVMVSVTLYLISKDKNNIINYYGLALYSVFIPLFDQYHIIITFYVFLIVFLSNLKFNFRWKIRGRVLIIGILIGMCFITGNKLLGNVSYPNSINHFEYRRLDNYTLDFTKEMNNFIRENKDKKIVFLNSNGYYFRIVNNQRISYLDLINDGNWGYNGDKKLFKALTSVDDAIYVVDSDELSGVYQTNKKIINYVINNGIKIKEIKDYDIYVIEEVEYE